MPVAVKLDRKKELKMEILRALTSLNTILTELEKQLNSLRNETNPEGRLAEGEEKVSESLQPVLDALGGNEEEEEEDSS